MFSGSWLELRSLVCIYPGYIKDTPRQLVHPLCAKHFGYSTESQRGCPLSVLGYLGVRCTGRGPDVEAQVASRLSIFRGAPPRFLKVCFTSSGLHFLPLVTLSLGFWMSPSSLGQQV